MQERKVQRSVQVEGVLFLTLQTTPGFIVTWADMGEPCSRDSMLVGHHVMSGLRGDLKVRFLLSFPVQ